MVTKFLRAPYSVSLFQKFIRFYGAYTALLTLRIQFKYEIHQTNLGIIVSITSIYFALQLISINRSIKAYTHDFYQRLLLCVYIHVH